MPLLRNRYPTPIIREVTPADVGVKSKKTASSPTSPKAVHFASTNSESKPLEDGSLEYWSLRNFEDHLKTCETCHAYYRDGRSDLLCPQVGAGLAAALTVGLEYSDKEIYTTSVDGKQVRLEVPSTKYKRSREYLRAHNKTSQIPQSRRHHTSSKARPVVEYDSAPQVTLPVRERPAPSVQHHNHRHHDYYTETIVTPSNTEREKHSSRSKHRSKRYSTVVLQDNVQDDLISSSSTSRATRDGDVYRGSLYDHDREMRRLQRHNDYIVEVVEPEHRERRRYHGYNF